MDTNDPAPGPTLTADINLKLGGQSVPLHIEVPAAPVRLRYLLPMVQSIANKVVESAVATEQREGRQISCKAGCGACCRQIVPISETEAYHIRDVVEAMPEPRRAEVRSRFAAARTRLEEADLLARVLTHMEAPVEETTSVGLDYFRLGIACPFLEEESCSIHPDRPVACREYLVTTPAENCSRPEDQKVRTVKLPTSVWRALARVDDPPGQKRLRWVPLVLAPEWADAHPHEPPPRTGPDLVRELFEHLTGKQVPAPPAT